MYSFATKQFRWLYALPSVYALMWPYIQAQGDEICFEVYKTGKNLQTKYEALYVSDGGLMLEEYNAIMRGVSVNKIFSTW